MSPATRFTWAAVVSLAVHAVLLGAGGEWLRQAPPPPQRKPPPRIELVRAAPEPAETPKPVPADPSPPPAAQAKPPSAPPAPRAAKRLPPEPRPAAPAPEAAPGEPTPAPRLARTEPLPAPESPPPASQPSPNGTRQEPPTATSRAEPAPPAQPRGNATAPGREDDLAYPESRADYRAIVDGVRSAIDRAKRYPRLARRAGWEGRALLKFRVRRSGEVAQVDVLESSGYALLDEAATDAVRRAAPFAGQAAGLERASIEVVLPVRFRLR